MLKFAVTLVVTGVFGQAAVGQQACFAQNMCDFRGFACESDVDDLRAVSAVLRNKAVGAEARSRKLQRSVNQLAQDNNALKARLEDIGTEDAWARERGKIVGDYASLLICVRQATSLEVAKTCLQG